MIPLKTLFYAYKYINIQAAGVDQHPAGIAIWVIAADSERHGGRSLHPSVAIKGAERYMFYSSKGILVNLLAME